MKKIPNPCTQDCPKRTHTCKFDGTCGRYDEYKEAANEQANKIYKERCKDYPNNSYVHYRMHKRKDRKR